MTEVNLIANQQGKNFYEKWLKETKNGVILYAPVLLLFYLGIGIVIYGLSLTFVIISIFPIFLILIAFVRPYYSRKNYVNRMVKSITLNDGIISIETYSWFTFKSIVESTPLSEISLSTSNENSFFEGRKIHILKISDVDNSVFFIVDDFFDNLNSLLALSK